MQDRKTGGGAISLREMNFNSRSEIGHAFPDFELEKKRKNVLCIVVLVEVLVALGSVISLQYHGEK